MSFSAEAGKRITSGACSHREEQFMVEVCFGRLVGYTEVIQRHRSGRYLVIVIES